VLLLVTILLVVVGSISLVIGFWQSSLLPIYISIGCSVLAAAVLLIFSRKTARSHQGGSDAPVPLDVGPVQHERPGSVPAFSDTGRHGSVSSDSFAPEPTYGAALDEAGNDDFPDEDFPIERYDTRRVGEILPLLAELDLDELDLVREREEQGKGRATVLARIDQLIDRLEAEDRQEAAHRFDPAGTDAGAGFAEETDDAPSAAVVEPAVPMRATQAVSVVALAEDDGYFPIEDYDDLQADEILPLLPELDDDELVMVRDRERSLAARPSILGRIDTQLGVEDAPEPVAEVVAEPEPEPVVAAEPIREPSPSVARRAAVKRAPAKRAPVAKKAAPQKEQPKKSPAAPVAKKLPVAKAPAPAKAAARRSAPGAPTKVTTATPTRKVTAAKDSTARKAPAEKVAAARSTAARSTAARSTAARAAAAVPKPAKATRKATSKG